MLSLASLRGSLARIVRRYREQDAPKPRPFFIRGFPRSGTNWLSSVLNLHPRIWVDGEFHFERLQEGVRNFLSTGRLAADREITRFTEASLWQLVEGILRVSVRQGKKRKPSWVGDRTPMPLEHSALPIPGSPVFYIYRDGRDALVSWTFHHLRLGLEYLDGEFKESLQPQLEKFRKDSNYFADHPEELLTSRFWVGWHADAWKRYHRLHRSFVTEQTRAARPSRVIKVRYEHMLLDIEGARSKLYRELDLNPAEAKPLSEKSRTIPGFAKENPNSFYRKGAAGEWRRYFNADATNWFKWASEDTLIELGYESDLNW